MLESLSAQTLADFEVIAVDDGSVDATPGILEANARGDSRFRVLRQEPAGMVAASERARAEARAPLLARMDADDVALHERLELQVAAIEEEGLAAFRRCKVHFLRRTLLAGSRAAVVWGASPTGKAFARDPRRGHAARRLRRGRPAQARQADPRGSGRPRRARRRLPGTLALGAVSGPEGRARVRKLAAGLGLVEGTDFVAIA